MPCYHPLNALYRLDERGRKDIVFNDSRSACISRNGHLYHIPILIPCGQCIGCRLEYSRQWAVRCMLEAQQYQHNYFLTLTYSDSHLPVASSPLIGPGGEVLFENSPLEPDVFTKWMKRFRKMCEKKYDKKGVRFYACGEYGGSSGRPHYHVLVFNAPEFDDLVLYRKNFDGSCLFNSPSVEATWGLGFCVIGEVTFNSAAYVARYMMKKHKGRDRDWYDKHGLVPEFSRMSRMPGIGRLYYDQNTDRIYHFDEIVITGKDGLPLKVRPPRYYDRLFDIDDHVSMQLIKDRRVEIGSLSSEKVFSRTSLSEEQYLSVQEGNKLVQLKSLKRS